MAQASKNATAMLRELILAGSLAGRARNSARPNWPPGSTSVAPRSARRCPGLAAEGLVEIVPNRGARVATWSDDDLEQIFELRLRLEPYAVGLAVPRLTDADLDELDDLARRMQALGKPGRAQDLDGIVHLNRQFHRMLIDRAANPALASSLLAVTHASVVNQNFHNYAPEALARSLAHHVEIVAAARAGNAGLGEQCHALPPVQRQGHHAARRAPPTGNLVSDTTPTDTAPADPPPADLPLADLRVVELGQLLAGPFCGQLLGDFGAEVIKVEDPGRGDPMREWGREKPHGKSLWWPVVARNKKSVTCNLRSPEGQRLLRRLIDTADILVENFRPGTLERWGLSPDELWQTNPGPDHHQGHRLRPDRSVRAARRLRLHR